MVWLHISKVLKGLANFEYTETVKTFKSDKTKNFQEIYTMKIKGGFDESVLVTSCTGGSIKSGHCH